MPLDAVRARNEAAAEAGPRRTYPRHARGRAAAPKPAGRPLPCVDLGAPTGETRRCRSCSGTVALKLFACGYGRGPATLAREVDGLACCRTCPDYRPRAEPPAPEHPNVAAAREFVRTPPAYPEGRYSGRGVVVVGGGSYWPSTYVTIRMLRHVGCALPAQVWYLGEGERDDRYAQLLAPFGVECVDALACPAPRRSLTGHPDPTGRNGPRHPPFEAKSYAALHSPFEEVLYLDADNYPCANPDALFDEPRYKAAGAVYWPDLPHTEAWTRWRDWGVAPFGPKCGFETGQYLWHKRVAWGPINLARWYDDRGDWCYGWGKRFDHGDKGPARVAWAQFRRAPAVYALSPTWVGRRAFVQCGPDGRSPLFVHRSQCKFVLAKSGFRSTPVQSPNARLGLPLEAEAFGYLDELRRSLA